MMSGQHEYRQLFFASFCNSWNRLFWSLKLLETKAITKWLFEQQTPCNLSHQATTITFQQPLANWSIFFTVARRLLSCFYSSYRSLSISLILQPFSPTYLSQLFPGSSCPPLQWLCEPPGVTIPCKPLV